MALSLQHFEDFLREAGIDFMINDFNPVPPAGFVAKVRTKADSSQYENYGVFVTEWLQRFSKFTRTSWNVRRTFPYLKLLAFKKRYVCHYSVHNKRRSKVSKKNKECPAKIDFIIKFINQNTMLRDKYLYYGFNVSITITFTHTHEVYVKEAFLYLNCDPEIETQFYKYFEDGMNPKEAKVYHQIRLRNDGESVDKLNKPQFNPTKDHIKYIYAKWKKEKYEENEQNVIIKENDSDEDSVINYEHDVVTSTNKFTTDFVRSLLDLQSAFSNFSSAMANSKHPKALTAIKRMTKMFEDLKRPEQVNEFYLKKFQNMNNEQTDKLKTIKEESSSCTQVNDNNISIKVEKLDTDEDDFN